MVFNSLTFLIFFPIVLGVYYLLPKKVKVYWLLAASYYFYAFWNIKYTVLIFSSTLITYLAGIAIGKAKTVAQKKWAVALSVIINLGMLSVFKYLNFFFSNISKLSVLIKGEPFEFRSSLLLPVGISFYTLQAIGYTIDVYRSKTEPEKNFVRYALFVSFFPQLVAGPIERSGNLLSQIKKIENEKLWNKELFLKGAFTTLYGFIMKMIIADRIAVLVNNAYGLETGNAYSGFQLIVATMLFAVQIYCDFAGYTYIAIGTAAMMGIKICDNFNAPLLSGSIKELWSRWHISLGSWFRDYLYIPLGGSRKGKLRRAFNTFVVFFASGFWHGASWHYIVWGVFHGMARIIEDATENIRSKFFSKVGYSRDTFAHRMLARVYTFILFTISLVFFRAESTRHAITVFQRAFHGIGLWQFTDGSFLSMGLDAKDLNVLAIFIVFITIVDSYKLKGKDVALSFARQNTWFKFLTLLIGILAVVIFGVYGAEYDAASFIYFQF